MSKKLSKHDDVPFVKVLKTPRNSYLVFYKSCQENRLSNCNIKNIVKTKYLEKQNFPNYQSLSFTHIHKQKNSRQIHQNGIVNGEGKFENFNLIHRNILYLKYVQRHCVFRGLILVKLALCHRRSIHHNSFILPAILAIVSWSHGGRDSYQLLSRFRTSLVTFL